MMHNGPAEPGQPGSALAACAALRLSPPAAKEKNLAKSGTSGKINLMHPWKSLTNLLLIMLLALSASGVVSAKVASGVQNLPGGLHQENITDNALMHLVKIDFSYDAASGSPVATKSVNKEITKSSRKRVKRLIKNLSDNSRQNNGLSQEKTDQLRRIVEKAGGKLRNDGATGVKGSSAGKPHVQTEGLGKSIDSRHIWTQGGVQ